MKLKFLSVGIMMLVSFSANSITNKNLSAKIAEAKFMLEKLQYHFKIKQKTLRPKSCPLESKANANIADALTALKASLDKECTSKNGALFSTLNSSINDINQTYQAEVDAGKRFEGHTKEDAVYVQNQARVEMVSKSLSTFGLIAQKAECEYSLRDQGVLSIMSDIIQSVSGLGLLVPNEYGFIGAAGGMAVGNILKVIDIMLKSKYNWKKEEDRNTFMSYNCSFFDIKDQMDAAGIISVKTDMHKTEIFKKTRELPKIRKLQKEIRVLIKSFESKKKLLVTRPLKMKRLGMAEFQVVEAMDRAKFIIQAKALNPKTWSKNMTAAQVKGEVIQELFEIYKTILEKVPQMKPAVLGKFAHKYEMPKSMAKFKNVFNGETEEEKIIPMFMSDTRAKTIKVPHDHLGYIDKTVKTAWFDVLKESYFTNIEWIYGALKRHEFLKTYPRQSITSLVRNPKLQAEKWIRRLELVENKFEARVRFLKNVTTGAVFKNNDDGTRIKNNILTSFKKIEDTIYGQVGESFVRYVNKYGRKDIKDFERRYTLTSDFYEHKGRPKGDRFQHCAEARKLQLQWGIAHSVINIGFDFIESNKDSFYKPKRRHKWFMGFVYAGKGRQRYLYEQAVSANKANRMIKSGDYDYKKIPLNNRVLKTTSVGRLMLRLKKDESKMQRVQNFIDKHRCNKN